MKFIFLFCILLSFVACKSHKTEPVSQPPVNNTAENYFPVTTYIKGQIADIKSASVNPLLISTTPEKTDSVWLGIDSLDYYFKDFLTPVIDTANLKSHFSESKFLDQSIPAYTWTYDLRKNVADTSGLKHWDVYVNPDNSKVERIFIIKTLPDNNILQLTWVSNNYARIIELNTNSDIKKDVTIKWRFDK